MVNVVEGPTTTLDPSQEHTFTVQGAAKAAPAAQPPTREKSRGRKRQARDVGGPSKAPPVAKPQAPQRPARTPLYHARHELHDSELAARLLERLRARGSVEWDLYVPMSAVGPKQAPLGPESIQEPFCAALRRAALDGAAGLGLIEETCAQLRAAQLTIINCTPRPRAEGVSYLVRVNLPRALCYAFSTSCVHVGGQVTLTIPEVSETVAARLVWASDLPPLDAQPGHPPLELIKCTLLSPGLTTAEWKDDATAVSDLYTHRPRPADPDYGRFVWVGTVAESQGPHGLTVTVWQRSDAYRSAVVAVTGTPCSSDPYTVVLPHLTPLAPGTVVALVRGRAVLVPSGVAAGGSTLPLGGEPEEDMKIAIRRLSHLPRRQGAPLKKARGAWTSPPRAADDLGRNGLEVSTGQGPQGVTAPAASGSVDRGTRTLLAPDGPGPTTPILASMDKALPQGGASASPPVPAPAAHVHDGGVLPPTPAPSARPAPSAERPASSTGAAATRVPGAAHATPIQVVSDTPAVPPAEVPGAAPAIPTQIVPGTSAVPPAGVPAGAAPTSTPTQAVTVSSPQCTHPTPLAQDPGPPGDPEDDPMDGKDRATNKAQAATQPEGESPAKKGKPGADPQ